ncbi:HesB/IscA family protein [Marinicrinis lubricantis]|uniref:HesB/IscA family protein n=1 Tax=Marinicrinis lubricantis TaxID=2086470 RepID=A0ABW1IUH5_9BACL
MMTITESAVDQIKDMLAAQESSNLFLRVGVKEGGCSGFSYGMGFDDEVNSEDETLEVNGLKVVVDPYSARFLNGVIIDFKQSDVGGGFTIDNPNAIATCGCGSSFRTAKEAGKPGDC